MKNTVEISQTGLAIQKSWGEQKVITTALATITSTEINSENIHKENYEIEFSRNQITGTITHISCKPREEETTTEYTLTCETVCDLCTDELE